MTKNILELCLSPDLGGLELFVLTCFREFKTKTKCEITIAPNSKLDKLLENENKFILKRNKFFPIFPALKLAKYIDKQDIDIIHFHWTKDIALVVLAKVLSKKKPKIIQSRHMTMTRFKDDFYHKWLYKNINTIHAVTNQVKEQLEKFIPKSIAPKIKMVHIGTEAKDINHEVVEKLKLSYGTNGKFVVGIVGRIEENKGQFLVIEAIEKLKHLPIVALIVGDTMEKNYLESLKEKTKKLEIEDKVIFTGFTKDVNEHMKLFDINILATPRETFGLVVIEAMANEICVCATNKGGPLEIIDDGVDGILFNRDSDDLKNKIEMLYLNHELKEKLALRGKQKATEMFDKTTQLNRLFGVINES